MTKKIKPLNKRFVLVLRCVRPDMRSRNNFKYPKKGYVSAPDWNGLYECGGGLHGWLWGYGAVRVADYSAVMGKWLVLRVLKKNLITLDGKVKFKGGNVIFCGNKTEAMRLINKHRKAMGEGAWWNIRGVDRATAFNCEIKISDYS